MELHKKQGGGEIILKCNQLVDKKIIKELYRASMAGVRVRLIIRGICCLRPGVPGISDNITVTSIVGRFLEHARVYWFRNGGDGIMYIGSADIMPRNLDRRIEVLIPVSNGEIRRHIREYVLDRQLRDNMQSWHMCPDGTYKRVHLKDGEEPVNAQEMLLVENTQTKETDAARGDCRFFRAAFLQKHQGRRQHREWIMQLSPDR